ncbi:MAG: response regulator [Planctomycetales bacterium]|nr:response regulator [Planctomycetales bacterium]
MEITKATHTVLLVDDEPNLLHSLSRTLRGQPYQIYTARSAEEAKDILIKHRVHLIVTDENMRGMRGSDLLAWVAEQMPEVVRIVLTGQPSVPTMTRAINEGRVFRFFTKPCNDVELAMAIRDGLELQAAEQG